MRGDLEVARLSRVGRRLVLGVAVFVLLCRCTTTYSEKILEPTEATPFRACEIICTGSGYISFEAQHQCSAGSKRQWRDVQLIGRILDHWLACAEYDVKEHRCSLAREVPKSATVLMPCEQFKNSIIDAMPNAQFGRDSGTDGRGNPLPEHQ